MKNGPVPATVIPVKIKTFAGGKYPGMNIVMLETTADGYKAGLRMARSSISTRTATIPKPRNSVSVLFPKAVLQRAAFFRSSVRPGSFSSELVLLFLYVGVITLWHAFDDRRLAGRAAGILVLIGVVNLPIIHYSVEWWNTLHQGSTRI